MSWWDHAVLYHVYVRSFADSDGDGVGDLDGVVARLDHITALGADAIWLSPVTRSPDADWGYDVSDYRSVQPALGGEAALDRLLAAASARGIRVLLDLVPNHTSVEHPWFIASRSSRDDPRRDWYVWADGRGDGPPNNWISDFDPAGSAWGFDDLTGQWYLHSFLPEQADLNWHNHEVRAEFLDLLESWFVRGAGGVRIDVAHKLVVDRLLRDNPPLSADADAVDRLRGQRQLHNAEQPELHDILRAWRRVADRPAEPRLLLGETYVGDVRRMAAFAGRDDELQLCLNVPFLLIAPFTAAAVRAVVDATLSALPPSMAPLWCGSNHDLPRLATRWAGGAPGRTRAALLLLLTLPGTALLYYGDEIGMPSVDVPAERARDRVDAVRRLLGGRGRDGDRTPMQWRDVPGGGFCPPGVEPWLPLGDTAACSVAGQTGVAGSTLEVTRAAIALRRLRPGLRSRALRWLDCGEEVLGYVRGEGSDAVTVLLNLGQATAEVEAPHGTVLLATGAELEGGTAGGRHRLGGGDGVVIGT